MEQLGIPEDQLPENFRVVVQELRAVMQRHDVAGYLILYKDHEGCNGFHPETTKTCDVQEAPDGILLHGSKDQVQATLEMCTALMMGCRYGVKHLKSISDDLAGAVPPEPTDLFSDN